MRSFTRFSIISLAAASMIVAAFAAGCGSPAASSTPAEPAAQTPAAQTPAAVTTVATSATVTGGSPAAAGGAPIEIATDNKFSQTSYTIKAGQPFTLTIENKGPSIHNWHVTDVKGSDGKDIQTPLVDAGKTASVTFTITKPGTYHFQCDVHPTDMKGTLTVQ